MPVDKSFLKSALGEIAAENEIANEKVARIVTTQEERDESIMPERKLVYMRQLVTFPNHPFHVRDDEDMQKLLDSVRKSGIRRFISCPIKSML